MENKLGSQLRKHSISSLKNHKKITSALRSNTWGRAKFSIFSFRLLFCRNRLLRALGQGEKRTAKRLQVSPSQQPSLSWSPAAAAACHSNPSAFKMSFVNTTLIPPRSSGSLHSLSRLPVLFSKMCTLTSSLGCSHPNPLPASLISSWMHSLSRLDLDRILSVSILATDRRGEQEKRERKRLNFETFISVGTNNRRDCLQWAEHGQRMPS